MPLTDIAIRKAILDAKPTKLTDSGGLYVLFKPTSGAGTTHAATGRSTKQAQSGYLSDTRLADARTKRGEVRQLPARGLDPGKQRKATRTACKIGTANSFEVIARE